eukprot:TRINITY_DN9856_c0_g2_i1.p1 TRINITY_DN9856_c0_g2~~TRINITY_DN9856_c0_g2_i1.p1  ORF type:complete len:655 (+),score=211.43 TRINITY_DN9856_c0_g2_i1:157-2121(+)
MSVRELSRRILQSFWRGVYREQPKRAEGGREHQKQQVCGYRTLEDQGRGGVGYSGGQATRGPQPPAVGGGQATRGPQPQVSGGQASTRGPQQPPANFNANKKDVEWSSHNNHQGRRGGSGGGDNRRQSVSIEIKPRSLEGSKYDALISARKALIGNVLKRVTNSQAANLRRRAAGFLTGDGSPASFLALVGVSLASGTGIMTKEDEIEGVCQEIRQAVSKTSLLRSQAQDKQQEEAKSWSLSDFAVGEPIAKGCSAVVYSARVLDAKGGKEDDFNLAIKMMFNYHAESNALIILRAMQREIVAARNVSLPPELNMASHQLGLGRMIKVPQHPNIVEIYTAFADRVPGIPGAVNLYGDALPARLNPEGSGRNMSLFLVMRRYDCSLRDYLSTFKQQLNTRISTVLFTQLLEGIAFLYHTGVAHRDLKSDNLLVDLSGGAAFPRLVITDFGCCLADPRHRLKLPYSTFDTEKGGNPALMAPEVACAMPGTFKTIDYSKSDLWAAGAIAYEIFGGKNPFYPCEEGSNKTPGLLSTNYTVDDLPGMPGGTPTLIQRLVNNILQREPERRPSPKQAATVCQLFLWSPSTWMKEARRVSSQDVLQWLLTMTTKVLCESRWGNTESALQEYQLVATFLTTTSLQDIKSSLVWIQEQIEEDE